MPVTVNASQRDSILRYASDLDIDASDPVAVSAAAIPLLEWAEQASSRSDLRALIDAMRQHRQNVRMQRIRSAMPVAPQTPQAFVESAQVLYAFLVSGPDETDDEDFGFGLSAEIREKLRKLDRRIQGES